MRNSTNPLDSIKKRGYYEDSTGTIVVIEHDGRYLFRAYQTAAQCEQSVVAEHSLLVSVTDEDRLNAHWNGFADNATKAQIAARFQKLDRVHHLDY